MKGLEMFLQLFPSFRLNYNTIASDFTFTRNSFATRVNELGLIETVTDLGSELVRNGDFEELSSELVTNGSFDTDSDWSKVNATISDGKGNLDGNGQTSLLYQDILTNTKTYQATFTVSDYNAIGQAKVIDNTGTTLYDITSNGTFTFTFTHSEVSGNFLFRARTGAIFSVDNVSVKQVDPNDDWILGDGWSIGDGVAYSDNTQTTYGSLQQSNVTTIGKTYKLKFNLNLDSGVIQTKGNAVYKTYYPADNGEIISYFVADSTSFRFTNFPNNTLGTIDNVSVKEVLEDDIPRIDYSTGEAAFLLEPQSTNLVTYSEDFTQWSGISATLINSSSETNPSNINNVGLITGNSGTTSKFATLPVSTTSSKHTYSVFLKYNGHQFIQFASGGSTEYGNFDIQNGIVGSGSAGTTLTIESFNNDWYRCVLNTSASITPTNIAIALVDSATSSRLSSTSSVDSVYVWGAQAEALSYATSYIPTNGVTVTRAQETCVKNNLSTDGIFGGKVGTIFLHANDMEVVGTSLNTFTPFRLYRQISDKYRFYYDTDATFIGSNIDLSDNGGELKMAFSVSDTEITIYVNGSLHVVYTIVNPMPSDVETWSWSTETKYKERVKDFRIYTEALTDSELEDLTTI